MEHPPATAGRFHVEELNRDIHGEGQRHADHDHQEFELVEHGLGRTLPADALAHG